MFKILSVISLLALFAGQDKGAATSVWPIIFAFVITGAALFLSFIWLRNRFSLTRKKRSGTRKKKTRYSPVMNDESWKRVTSGEMAKELLRKEKSP
jgi:hypothetical protein